MLIRQGTRHARGPKWSHATITSIVTGSLNPETPPLVLSSLQPAINNHDKAQLRRQTSPKTSLPSSIGGTRYLIIITNGCAFASRS